MPRVTRYCAACLTTFFEDPERCTNLGCGSARPDRGWGQLLGPGDLLDRHYLIERVLAVGGAGLTYLAREADAKGEAVGPKVAIKVLYTARDTGPFLRRLANEAQILQELAHEHIVVCLGFVQRVGQEPYLVTLFEEGGSLQAHVNRVGPLPPRVAVGILRQVLLALDVAHQRAVVHRDLKPDNVLLARTVGVDEVPHVRVADFGIAKVHGGLTDRLTKLGSFVGTPEYAAPEQFEGLQPTPATDLFAAGGLLWYLVTGRAPVSFTQRHDLGSAYEELLAQVPPKLEGLGLDPVERSLLQDVLDHLMAHDPEARWTVHQVLHRLLPLSDGLAGRGSHTLELTDPTAPERAAAPTFASDAPFVREHDTAVPTFDSAVPTLEEPPPPPPTEEAPPPPPPPTEEAPPPPPPAERPADLPTVTPAPVPRRATPPPAPRQELPPAPDTEWVRASPPAAPLVAPSSAPPPLAEPTGTGGAVRAAGCLGLSFVGVAASGAVGAAGVAVVLLGAAAAFGWFGGGSSRLDPVVVRADPPATWSRTPQMLGGNARYVAKRHDVQDAASRHAAAVGKACGISGPVVVDLLVEPDGRVVYAAVDEEWLVPTRRECLEAKLAGLSLDARIPREMRVRVALWLP